MTIVGCGAPVLKTVPAAIRVQIGQWARRSSGIIGAAMGPRSDVVGSLLRPAYLVEARGDGIGTADRAGLQADRGPRGGRGRPAPGSGRPRRRHRRRDAALRVLSAT